MYSQFIQTFNTLGPICVYLNSFKNSKSAIEFEDPENPNQILKTKGSHIFDRRVVIGLIVVCHRCIFIIR